MSTPLEPTGDVVVPQAPAGGWRNPRGGYLFFVGFAAIGAAMGLFTPGVLTLTLKAQLIDPAHATTILAVTVAIAGLTGLIAFPVFGRLSDRTTSRFGRRRPYLVLGAVLFAIGAVLLVAASNVPVLVVGDLITSLGYSATLVSVTSTIADQVEPGRRGGVSTVVGLSVPLGALAGLFIAQTVSSSLALQIALPALFAVVGPLLLAFRLADTKLAADQRPAFGFLQFLSTFVTSPRKHPSFAWTWGSRFLIYFGVAALQAYQVFYLQQRLGFTPKTVSMAVFLTTLVLTGIALITAPIFAKISDRIGRRKPFVAASALVFAIGLALAAFAHSFPTFVIATAIVGLGQGVYFAVDVALVTQVLPAAKDTAKDVGVMNLANTLPFTVVPIAAPAVLAIGGGVAPNYMALFLLGAIASVIGAILILPIRGAR